MVVAIPVFGPDIAPRFCFAEEVVLVRLEGGRETNRQQIDLSGASGPARLRRLAELGVTSIMCGGFDRRLLPLASGLGIEVSWSCTGNFEAAIERAAHGGEPTITTGDEARLEAIEDETRLRVAVATTEPAGLDGGVGAHFGHCRFLALVDVTAGDVGSCRIVETPSAAGGPHGAMPHFVATVGARVAIAGGMGPRAVQRLNELGVEAATCGARTVREAVKAYLSGSLDDVAPCEYQGRRGDAGCGSQVAAAPRDERKRSS